MTHVFDEGIIIIIIIIRLLLLLTALFFILIVRVLLLFHSPPHADIVICLGLLSLQVNKNSIIIIIIERLQEWCSANLMKAILSKIRVISFSRKKTLLNYQYRLGNSFTLRTDCIKDLGVHIDSKLYLHKHVDSLFLHTMKLLGLIRTIAFSFSTLDSLLMLHIAIVRSELWYASVVWNSITNADSNILELIQRKFAALFHNGFFFQGIDYHCVNILDTLNFQILQIRHIDALFLINYFRGAKFCPFCPRSSRLACSYSEYPKFFCVQLFFQVLLSYSQMCFC
jgi:hypothetical protein